MLMEIMKPSSQSSGGSGGDKQIKSIYVAIKGESLPEILRRGTSVLERKVYIGHTEARFYTERLAHKDVSKVIDFYLRDHEARQNPYMVVVKGSRPELIYSCASGMSDNMGTYIAKMARTQMKTTAEAVFVKTLDFIKDYYEKGKQPIMGTVEIIKNTAAGIENNKNSSEKDGSEYLLQYKGLAAFKENKLVGYMDGIETRAYNIVVGNFNSAYIKVSTKPQSDNRKGSTVLEVISSNPKIKVSYDKKANIDIMVNMDIVIAQEMDAINIQSKEVKEEIEQAFEALLEGQILKAVEKAQNEFKSDIFGFGRQLHIQNPKQWDRVKEYWDEVFSAAEVNVEVKAKISMVGELMKPFLSED